MTKLETSHWQEMMNYLRQHHAPICRQWFEQLEPRGLDSGLLDIHTATSVQQNYLQKQCLDPFIEAAQAVTGALVAVRFVNGDQPVRDTTSRCITNLTDGSASAASAPTRPASSTPSSGTSTSPTRNTVRTIDFGDDQLVLSPDYSFSNFVQGPNNQLAYAASVAVANQPGTAYNPLFVHGGVGLGKTHLLQAICASILESNPNQSILYVSCESFTNQFIECVQSGNMSAFRHKYRDVDMLVIDDIHFLGHRERSQEEFFHTFNELYQSNRQIVLSSDAAPSEIPDLEDRLVSRFQWGLVAQVSKPSYETRLAILHAKNRLRGVGAPDEVIEYIARKVDSNARELEGAITTLQGHAKLMNRPLDLTLAREALGEPAPPKTNQVTLQHIIDAVTTYYNLKLSDLQSRRRHKSVTEPRQLCMWLARKRTRFSLEEIGGYFGGRDHTTVMHSIKTVDQRRETDDHFDQIVQQLDQTIDDAIADPG